MNSLVYIGCTRLVLLKKLWCEVFGAPEGFLRIFICDMHLLGKYLPHIVNEIHEFEKRTSMCEAEVPEN